MYKIHNFSYINYNNHNMFIIQVLLFHFHHPIRNIVTIRLEECCILYEFSFVINIKFL